MNINDGLTVFYTVMTIIAIGAFFLVKYGETAEDPKSSKKVRRTTTS